MMTEAKTPSKLRPTAKEFVLNSSAPAWTPSSAKSPVKSSLKLDAKPFVPSFMAQPFVPAAMKETVTITETKIVTEKEVATSSTAASESASEPEDDKEKTEKLEANEREQKQQQDVDVKELEAPVEETEEKPEVVAEQDVIGERIMYTIKQLLEMEPEVDKCPIPEGVKGMVIAADKTTKALSAPAPEVSKGMRRNDSSRSLGRHGSNSSFGEGRGRRERGNGRGGRGGRGGRSHHHDTAPPLEECAPLEINEETRWKPSHSKSRLDEPVETTEASLKEAKSILNKLSIEKFDKLSDQLIEVAVRGLEVLKGVIEMVIAKAQMEWHFSTMYAELCAKIAQTDMPAITVDDDEVVTDTHKLFRKLLLQRCQKEFEAKPAVEGLEDLPEDERLEKELIMKRASLGHIRFVGELFKQRMLSSRIMHECVSILFGDITAPDEESLECLCNLLSTIGQALEANAREKAELDHIGKYYATIKKLSGESKLLCTRVRFMLQDLLELRKNRWVARRKETKAMTIAEVHAEVAREAKEKERSSGKSGHARLQRSQSMNSAVGSNDRRRGSGGGASAAWKARAAVGSSPSSSSSNNNTPTVDADGWETVTGGARPKGLKNRSNSDRFPAPAPRHPSGSRLSGNAFATLSAGNAGKKERSNSSSSSSSRSSRSREDFGRPPTPNKSSNGRSSKSEQAAEPAEPAAPALTAEAFEKKVKAILDEYVELEDLEEACASFAELNADNHYVLIPSKALNIGLEKGDKERDAIASFLAGLYDRKIVTGSALESALQEVLEFAEDIEIDIPKTLPYLGQMVGPSVVLGAVTLPQLVSMSEHLCYNGKASKLIGSTLAAIVSCEDETKVKELLAEDSAAAIDFMALLAEANRNEDKLQGFYKDYSLEFLL